MNYMNYTMDTFFYKIHKLNENTEQHGQIVLNRTHMRLDHKH